MRAYVEHNLGAKSSLVKLYLIGPMFRHERPQSGRFRQFHQIDVEAVGSPGPAVDAEVVALLQHLLEAWGCTASTCTSTASATRPAGRAYREAFVAYLAGAPGRPVPRLPCPPDEEPAAHPGLQGSRPASRSRPGRRTISGLSVRAVPGPLRGGARVCWTA